MLAPALLKGQPTLVRNARRLRLLSGRGSISDQSIEPKTP
jgi:hypothetical protein